MKNLIRIFFIVLLFMTLVFLANGQSLRKIEKHTTIGSAYVLTSQYTVEVDEEEETIDFVENEVSCNNSLVKFYLSKKRVIVVTEGINLDLKVKQRHLDEYDSWIGVDKNTGQNYLVTGVIIIVSNASGILFQPITENGSIDLSRFTYIISGSPGLCE